MATKFRTAYGEKLHPEQNFDHKKITFKKAGKDYNIYDLIQASREDTEIYPTLEKYNMLPNIENAAQFAKRADGFYAEFEETMNLRDFHEMQIKANNMWKDLPLEIREEFHNDVEEFMTNGLNDLKKYTTKKEEEPKEVENNEPKQ